MTTLWVSRTKIQWETGLPDVKPGDQVHIEIPRFGIDADYRVTDVDPFGIYVSDEPESEDDL